MNEDGQDKEVVSQPHKDKEGTLNYIDKLYSTAHSIGSLENRATIIMLILSLFLFALAQDILSVDGKLTWQGLKLTISLPFLLASLVVAITALPIYVYLLDVRASILHRKAAMYYRHLERNDLAENLGSTELAQASLTDPFLSLDLATTVVQTGLSARPESQRTYVRFYNKAVGWAFLGLLWFGPVCAEGAALWRLVALANCRLAALWLPLALVPFFVVTILIPIIWHRDDRPDVADKTSNKDP
jgi:hypothetical protein